MKKQLMIAAIVLLCASCKKSETQSVHPSVQNNLSFHATDSSISPANPSNPYDGFGALHNEGMNYIVNAMRNAGEKRSEQTSKYVQAFIALKTGKKVTRDYYALFRASVKDSANNYAKVIEKAKVSSVAKAYLKEIFEIISSRKAMQAIIPADIKNEIIAVEDRIIRDKALSEQVRTALLKESAIARYSTYWWSTNLPAGADRKIFRGIFSFVVGVLADLSAFDGICGAITSYINGEWDPIGLSVGMYYGAMYL